jgi:pyrimidine-specific ribonucleoside hydrolase
MRTFQGNDSMNKQITIAGSLLLGMAFWTGAMTHHQHTHDSGAGDHVVLKHLPTDRNEYLADVSPLVEQIIHRHGEQEWGIVVLTSEFHRHLGIYSILGAKMGLCAREYFQAGLDELLVESFAGLNPPISCLNDGLQVSTGATLGHGTITIVPGESACPQARFTHNDRTITLTLKPGYWNQIRKDIQTEIEEHGNKTPAYWQAVRQLGLQYWLQWHRNDLFELTETVR